MADLADVENALKGLIVGWTYPSGSTQPSAVQVGGKALTIATMRGWPDANYLKADLAKGIVDISIYSQPGSERLTTRYPREWEQVSVAPTTITVASSGDQVILSGTVSTPQNVAILIGFQAYLHAVQASDTLATIAAALAALIPGATSSGPVITVPASRPQGRVASFGTAIRELRRQERLFQITIWSATPEQRDAVAGFIDQKFAGARDPNGLEFIQLPDGTQGRLKYQRTVATDKDELSGSFRRDLIYSVEYATTEVMSGAQVVTFDVALSEE